MANLSKLSLPLGSRFLPYDVELVMYYLKRKVTGRKFKLKRDIPDIALKNYSPSEIREVSYPKTKDLEGFFFCSLGRRYSKGLRKDRSGKGGSWKATTNGKPIYNKSRKVGWRTTLTFYRGKGRGTRTDWRIHEYMLEDKELPIASNYQNEFVVLCKIFEKKSRGPKTDEEYESPVEEDADESSSIGPAEGQNTGATISKLDFENRQDTVLQPLPPHTATPIDPQHHPSSPENDVHKLLLNVSDEDGDTCNGGGSSQVDPNKSTGEDVGTPEIFKNLGDIIGQREMNLTGGFLEEDDLSEPMEDEEGFRWEDFFMPMAADGSNHGTCDCLLAANVTPVLPAHEAMDSCDYENISGYREPTCDSAAHSPLKAGEIVGPYAPQSLARGKQLNLHLGLECILKEGWFLTNVQFLLGSIVACPASTTLYPSSLDCESYRVGCGFSCSIIVKDEMTIIYTKDGLLGMSRSFPFWSYFDLAEMLVTIRAISMSIDFMFVFVFKCCVSFDRCSLCLQLVPNLGGIHGCSICSSFVTILFPFHACGCSICSSFVTILFPFHACGCSVCSSFVTILFPFHACGCSVCSSFVTILFPFHACGGLIVYMVLDFTVG